MDKKIKAMIYLRQMSRMEILSNSLEGHVFFRKSGIERIVKIQPRVMTLVSINADGVIIGDPYQTWEFKGLHVPVGYITNKFWDDDDRWYPIRPSNYLKAAPYLPQKDGLFFTGQPSAKEIAQIVHHRTPMWIDEGGFLYKAFAPAPRVVEEVEICM